MSIFINNARYSNVVIGRTPNRRRGLDPRFLPRLPGKRSGLLLTTTLATGLVLGVGMAPHPAVALTVCATPGPNPGVYRYYSVDDDISCVTTPDYTNPAGTTLDFRTHTSDDNDIYVNNSGTLSPSNNGIYTFTGTDLSDIEIKNSGDIHAGGDGIVSAVSGYDSNVHIYNYDNIYATAAGGDGFNVVASGYSDDIVITNTGKLDVGGYGFGVGAQQGSSTVTITNSGDVRARTDGFHVYTLGDHSDITITNNGEKLIAGDDGFYAGTAYDNSNITIKNHAAIETMATGNGIETFVQGYRSAVEVHNYNSIKTVSGDGIHAEVGNYPLAYLLQRHNHHQHRRFQCWRARHRSFCLLRRE